MIVSQRKYPSVFSFLSLWKGVCRFVGVLHGSKPVVDLVDENDLTLYGQARKR